jgi:hypothetical protein
VALHPGVDDRDICASARELERNVRADEAETTGDQAPTAGERIESGPIQSP